MLKIKKKFLQLHCLRCDISLQNKHSSSLEPSSLVRTEGWQRVFTNRQQKSGWQRQRHLSLRLYPFDSLASLPRLFAGREQRPLGSPGLQKPLGTGGREAARQACGSPPASDCTRHRADVELVPEGRTNVSHQQHTRTEAFASLNHDSSLERTSPFIYLFSYIFIDIYFDCCCCFCFAGRASAQ